jgi:DsbC/DsbD-like thiol-disulfide interchange protein
MRGHGIRESGLGIRRIPNPKSRIPILICGAVLLTGVVAHGQLRRPRADVTALIESTAVRAGSSVRVALRVVLPEGLHTQSNKPRDPLLIPTALTIDTPAGVTWDEVVFPPSTDFHSAGQDQPLAVFEHEFVIGVRLTLADNVATGDIVVPAHLRYQACDENLCYPPATANTEWTLKIVPAAAAITPNPDAI